MKGSIRVRNDLEWRETSDEDSSLIIKIIVITLCGLTQLYSFAFICEVLYPACTTLVVRDYLLRLTPFNANNRCILTYDIVFCCMFVYCKIRSWHNAVIYL